MVAACRPDRLRSHPPHYIEPSSGSPRSQSIFRIGLAVQGIVGRESCPNRKRTFSRSLPIANGCFSRDPSFVSASYVMAP
jgi:hypothetical protein